MAALLRFGGPGKNERRQNQRAGQIAEPPCDPDALGAPPRRVARQIEARDANRRARGCAQAGDEREAENVGHASVSVAAARETLDEIRAQNGFDGVAGRDAERRRDRSGGGDVDEKGAGEDGRPQVAADQEQRRDRDSRRRPHGRRARMHGRQREPCLCGGHVADKKAHPRQQPAHLFSICRAMVAQGRNSR